jgi:hypothetical protein
MHGLIVLYYLCLDLSSSVTNASGSAFQTVLLPNILYCFCALLVFVMGLESRAPKFAAVYFYVALWQTICIWRVPTFCNNTVLSALQNIH